MLRNDMEIQLNGVSNVFCLFCLTVDILFFVVDFFITPLIKLVTVIKNDEISGQ